MPLQCGASGWDTSEEQGTVQRVHRTHPFKSLFAAARIGHLLFLPPMRTGNLLEIINFSRQGSYILRITRPVMQNPMSSLIKPFCQARVPTAPGSAAVSHSSCPISPPAPAGEQGQDNILRKQGQLVFHSGSRHLLVFWRISFFTRKSTEFSSGARCCRILRLESTQRVKGG